MAYLHGDVTRLDFVDLGPVEPDPSSRTAMASGGWFSWRPDGRRFATGGDDGFVRVWDWTTGQLITERQVARPHLDH